MRNRRVRRSAWFLLLVAAGVATWFIPVTNVETGKFVLKSSRQAEMRAFVAGFVTTVHFREGNSVSMGDLVVEMEVPELESDIVKKLAQIEESRARIRLLGAEAPERAAAFLADLGADDERTRQFFRETGQSESEMSYLQSGGKIQEIQAELDYARKKYELSKKLNSTKVISDDRLSEVKRDYEVWMQKYQQVLSEQEVENARLGRLIEEASYLNRIKAKLMLNSPIDGVVITPQIEATQGRYFEEGELIVEIVDPKALEAEVTVDERYVSSVGIGQGVVLKPFSLPYQTFDSAVVRIAPVIDQPEMKDGRAVTTPGTSGEIKLYCDIEKPTDELTPGMSGYARIFLADDKFGNIVMNRFLRFVRTEFWW